MHTWLKMNRNTMGGPSTRFSYGGPFFSFLSISLVQATEVRVNKEWLSTDSWKGCSIWVPFMGFPFTKDGLFTRTSLRTGGRPFWSLFFYCTRAILRRAPPYYSCSTKNRVLNMNQQVNYWLAPPISDLSVAPDENMVQQVFLYWVSSFGHIEHLL